MGSSVDAKVFIGKWKYVVSGNDIKFSEVQDFPVDATFKKSSTWVIYEDLGGGKMKFIFRSKASGDLEYKLDVNQRTTDSTPGDADEGIPALQSAHVFEDGEWHAEFTMPSGKVVKQVVRQSTDFPECIEMINRCEGEEETGIFEKVKE